MRQGRTSLIIIPIVLVILAFSAFFILSREPSLDDGEVSVTVDSIATGMLYAHIADYELTRNSLHPHSRDYPDGSVIVGQILSTGELGLYHIYRPCLYFDTSFLESDAQIQSARITIHAITVDKPVDYDIIVLNGQPEYPHYPMEGRDYYRGNYTGNGGSVNIAEITAGENYYIPLNADGISWINKAGITKLFLRSSRDIEGSPPILGEGERVQGEKWAKLTITYVEL